jgi:hypothetical protein
MIELNGCLTFSVANQIGRWKEAKGASKDIEGFGCRIAILVEALRVRWH